MSRKRKAPPDFTQSPSHPLTHKIIVGVDYGTTYTGAGYASTKDSGLSDVIMISTWPGPSRDSETVLKTPSRIAYGGEDTRITGQRWGYQVEPGMTAYSWTKLLLDKNTPLTKFDDTALKKASGVGILMLPEGKTAVDVVTDYLAEVYKHIMKTIAKMISEEALSVTPIDFWFTVPAIWSDEAQAATREAAKRAGFASPARRHDKIYMISEPEAAAITALEKYTRNGGEGSVKRGDGVLICDCGGGTVDITTYLVNQTEPALKFEELCTGNGGKCGSTAIDREFYQLMSNRFGDSFDLLPMKRKGPGSDFMKKFEIIKRDFGHSDDNTLFELPLNMKVESPDPSHFDDEERLVILSRDDLRGMFDAVVDRILNLVRQQITDARAETGRQVITRIILVGGFGDSEYLRKAFRSAFELQDKIAITVPDNPQAAIVQGAVLRGLEGLRSTTRRCRRHYGFMWDYHFRPGIDKELHCYRHPFTGVKMVRNVMKWMIAKGDKYSEGHACTVDMYIYLTDGQSSMTLYSCDLPHAPERFDAQGTQPVGTIHMTFSNRDLKHFEWKMKRGRVMYEASCRLRVVFGSQEGVLKFEVTCRDKVVGQAIIDFHSHDQAQ
ncbi:actin-like ATPase domain-containing protein [Aspergillus sclerotiicarbonarius CBS 121057]|uniref:Actin-like ATPase domain-containing protein n=1 Tax=Aspergillus sclerotiicarbonarius (strain CBS 121057 / IBT 28362) TaxID=1448318 RepID=A0A319F9X2_ASPSB|nr:actin-like ATPase domain-containing protein [Aspergillus sclerotiicarbonarius CBS 121057]